MRFFKKKIIFLALFGAISLILNLSILKLHASGVNIEFLKSVHLPIQTIQGTSSALNMLLCILMVFTDYNYGRKIALSCILLTISIDLFIIFSSGDFTPFPGIITSLITLITVEFASRYSKKITISSYTDSLTGLRNRRAFINTLDDFMETNTPFYLAYFELKNLHAINEKSGYKIGDIGIKAVAGRLSQCCATNMELGKDFLFRLDGSSAFALIFTVEQNAEKKLSDLIYVLENPITFKRGSGNLDFKVDLAAGLVKFPENGRTFLDLSKNIDTALNYAKLTNKHFAIFSDKELQEVQKKKYGIVNLINDAFENDRFTLMYQPEFNAATKEIRGFEALLRLKGEHNEIILPEAFIPEAEKSALIKKIGEYVLEHAMLEFKEIIKKTQSELILSVNISAMEIADPHFASVIEKLVEKTLFPPQCLELEITEHSLTTSSETVFENMVRLKNSGIQFALDDFGNGYSSISQLLKVPIDLIKIDKSIIENIDSNSINQEIVDTMIYMGHILKCKVLSEGVESENQLEIIKKHGCDYVQGFVWSKPLSFEETQALCSIKK
ncbi:putative bifunctional diguanylate cyclase/phosphodiesterase [Treponema zioleckii]|uniref:putative bifunctional diguanylate cyclase/phosphodiesterase n=1 Tax=Treponema zioleckii TaxID=331680 RepID=UPI00168AA301|nr:bifunctional diguanylate cyclase/phosphodiesterase [Treponema zioleckii]